MTTTKKHILICASDYFPRIGGAEVAVKEITEHLSDVYTFSLIAPRLEKTLLKEETIGSVRVYRVGFGGLLGKVCFPFIGVWKGLHIHREHPVHLLWGIMASWGGIMAARLHAKTNIPFVLTMQEGDEEEHLMRYVRGNRFLYNFFIRWWYQLPIREATGLTAISEYLQKRAQSAGAKVPITIVPNGADIARFRKGVSDHEKQLIRQSLGLGFDATVLLNVSRLVEKNNVADTISSLAHMPETYHLVVLGAGFLKESLRTHARTLGVEKRVHLVGRVEHEQVPTYMSIADVFVRTPHSEGFGNVFIEAMAAGIPVVATPVGGIPDFLVDPRTNVGKVAPTGIFAEPGNPKSIAEGVGVLMRKKELRETIVQDAQELVVEKYDWSRIAGMMGRVFDKTLQI